MGVIVTKNFRFSAWSKVAFELAIYFLENLFLATERNKRKYLYYAAVKNI